jgi:DNA-damage-inducible protein D
MTDLTLSGQQSPFDAIKHVCPDGTELWSARDLMPLLGYSAWRNFQTPLERAMVAADNQGYKLIEHFAGSRKVAGSGPDAHDYSLTRFAAYLVAMNGDPNKAEVAAAQAYFAIKTREAETAPTTAAMLTRSDLARMILAAESELAETKAELEQAAPAAAAWDALAEAEGDYSLRDAAQILSRDPAIKTGQNRLMVSIRELGMVDGSGQPYQRHIAHLQLRVTSYPHPHSGEPVLSRQIRVTVSGLKYLHTKLGGTQPLRLMQSVRQELNA